MVRISASILGFLFEAKKNKLSDKIMIDRINCALFEKKDEFDILHLDIEDGKFVDYKSFTSTQIRKIKSPHKIEAHFMVLDYKKYIKEYFHLTDMFIFHNEILKRDFSKTIDFLKKNNKFVGISISPETSVDEIKYLDKIDSVLVMSVVPGLPGQKFIDYSLRKIKKLNEIRKTKKYHYTIEVDGGIDDIYAKKCITAGADVLVIGSHFFKS
ncbi:MAG: ribulose-phosphate 3-epimerase [Candidatus Woesearchaeota archaeon]